MRPDRHPAPGRVSLVGAGPGDPDLLTLRALRAVEAAQALLFDALVDPRIVALAPERCVRIGVGKRGGALQVPQEKTNALMARLARRGLHVVRLKGGDPSLFGRVEEERAYLRMRGIATETIPGITAASAAAAQFEFPLTHRGVARRVLYLTGRTQDGAAHVAGLEGAVDPDATLVFYMAAHVAAEIAAALIRAGRPADAPTLIVQNAGAARARAVKGVLGSLAEDATGPGLGDGPTLIVVGAAAGYARNAQDRGDQDACAMPSLTPPALGARAAEVRQRRLMGQAGQSTRSARQRV